LAAPVQWPEPRTGGIDPALLEAFVPTDAVAPVLDKLRRPDVLVVTTGQQPGLFTGPLYTIHKALSAVALARACEARWRRPVVPVFWAAGGDHDFAEGNHATWNTPDGPTVTMTLRERSPDAPLTPLYREPVGPEIEPVLARLAADIGALPYGEKTVELFRRWYRPDTNLSAACAGVIAELLAPFGVVVFDATSPATKRAQWPVLLKALAQAEPLDGALVARHAELRAAGKDPGVAVGDGATLVMVEGAKGRDRLATRSPGFVTRRSHEQFSLAEIEKIGIHDPGRFSPNVLLRPAVESYMLPTVAYVAGPGELRYLALADALYAPLGIARQLPVPRWSGMLVDARVDRVLAKFDASLGELLLPGHQLEKRVVRANLPTEAVEALAALRSTVGPSFSTLIGAAAAIDPTIERSLAGIGRRAAEQVERAEQKLVNHLRKRHSIEARQIERARELVLPLGQPQERVITLAPWLAKYGPSLLADLAAEIQQWYDRALVAAQASS
ncbi:MAG TPA: bacillithiol biosynthesis cysteine-adding enzyme BshC, partial [Gemmatimonadales bacterium]|nr:bacillithiol biosynthesis cysteine-adding enzyme BshC [Gemmatimonadales bacterium]